MAHNIVKIDPDQVGEMAKRFSEHATQIGMLSGQIGITLSVLQGTRFCGHVGDTVMAKYNDEFVARFQTLEQKLTEISTDLVDAVSAYTESDTMVSDYFGDTPTGAI